jgi:hypothetical protein
MHECPMKKEIAVLDVYANTEEVWLRARSQHHHPHCFIIPRRLHHVDNIYICRSLYSADFDRRAVLAVPLQYGRPGWWYLA